MTQFDLRKSLGRISPDLRRELFSRWPSLASLDWSQMAKQRCVGPLFERLQSMTAEEKREINLLLRTFESLKRESGLKVLLEELRQRSPEQVGTWGAIKAPMDKVVWTYLHAKPVFEEAIVFARADALTTTRHWRKWSAVKCEKFESTPERIAALEDSLVEHHSEEFRGDRCKVHHYSRRNGAEYFFAYLPNWHEDFMIFTREGDLQSLDLPTAFSILFVFTPETGVLEMIASGGVDVQLSLRRRFYAAMTRTEVKDLDPARPAYELDHLLEPGFSFTGHDTAIVKHVDVMRITLVPTVSTSDVDGVTLRLRGGIGLPRVLARIDRTLASFDLDRTQVSIDEIVIRIQCVGDGRRQGRRLTFKVTPRTCELKSVEDEDLRVLGEKSIRAWRIDRG
ncbi:MAG: hypothetical protein JNL80_15710 [Phycisphaerae bacterium]|nr:hypothetical protein [Phycisphaerae bacterium]